MYLSDTKGSYRVGEILENDSMTHISMRNSEGKKPKVFPKLEKM